MTTLDPVSRLWRALIGLLLLVQGQVSLAAEIQRGDVHFTSWTWIGNWTDKSEQFLLVEVDENAPILLDAQKIHVTSGGVDVELVGPVASNITKTGQSQVLFRFGTTPTGDALEVAWTELVSEVDVQGDLVTGRTYSIWLPMTATVRRMKFASTDSCSGEGLELVHYPFLVNQGKNDISMGVLPCGSSSPVLVDGFGPEGQIVFRSMLASIATLTTGNVGMHDIHVGRIDGVTSIEIQSLGNRVRLKSTVVPDGLVFPGGPPVGAPHSVVLKELERSRSEWQLLLRTGFEAEVRALRPGPFDRSSLFLRWLRLAVDVRLEEEELLTLFHCAGYCPEPSDDDTPELRQALHALSDEAPSLEVGTRLLFGRYIPTREIAPRL